MGRQDSWPQPWGSFLYEFDCTSLLSVYFCYNKICTSLFAVCHVLEFSSGKRQESGLQSSELGPFLDSHFIELSSIPGVERLGVLCSRDGSIFLKVCSWAGNINSTWERVRNARPTKAETMRVSFSKCVFRRLLGNSDACCPLWGQVW